MNTPQMPFDAFDATLKAAMQARPPAPGIKDLAMRAMNSAKARQSPRVDYLEQFQIFIRQRQRAALVNAIGAMVLIGVMIVAYFQFNSISASGSSASQNEAASVDTSLTTLNDGLLFGLSSDELMLSAAAMLVGIVLLFCLERMLSDDRNSAAVMGWSHLNLRPNHWTSSPA